MLAKYIVKKYGYKWDDSWEDTDNPAIVLETMVSMDEDLDEVINDIYEYTFRSNDNE